MHIGDSFAAGRAYFNIAVKYDSTIINTVIRELFLQDVAVILNGGLGRLMIKRRYKVVFLVSPFQSK